MQTSSCTGTGLAALVLCGSLLGASSVSADEFLKLNELMKDIALSSGTETAVPRFFLFDDNADDYPDRFRFRFDFYESGTTTRLTATRERTTTFPPTSCVSPVWEDYEFEPRIIGDPASNRSHAAVLLTASCQEAGSGEFKEDFKTFVYSGNGADATSWARTYDLEMIGFNGFDWDKDGTNEGMLGLIIPSTNGEDLRIIWHNFGTGAVESARTYKIVEEL